MGIFSRIFGGSKQPDLPPIDFSSFLVDMHSHLIPGIDDGSKSMDETIAMLAKFESLGYKKVITTPHVMSDFYRNTPEIILEGLEKVRSVANELNLKIQIEAAAEYYYDDSLLNRLYENESLLTFGDNYLLFEFSMQHKPEQIEDLFFNLLTQNYKPVLAHFERYPYFHGSTKELIDWRGKGINIQLNLNSLIGHYGPNIQKQAELMVSEGLVDFVGSDCHRIDHLMLMDNNRTLKSFHQLTELPLKNPSLI